MKRSLVFGISIFMLAAFCAGETAAQRFDRFTGTAIIYGSGFSTRSTTRTFDLILSGRTSDEEAERYHQILKQDGGQQRLSDMLRDNDLGRISFSGRIGPTVVAAFERKQGDKRRLMVVFERWIGFGEFRAGARSLDYPFGVLEMVFDPVKNRGEGTFISAARVRLGKDDETKEDQIELEGFGTFPGKLIGVRQTERRAQ